MAGLDTRQAWMRPERNKESHRRFDTRQDVSRLYPLGGSHSSREVLWDEPQTASARSSAVERLVLNFSILVETLLKCQRMSRNRRRRQILTCSEQECGQDETEKDADASRHNRMFHSSILRKLEASRYRHTMCETKDCNTLERWGFRLGSLADSVVRSNRRSASAWPAWDQLGPLSLSNRG